MGQGREGKDSHSYSSFPLYWGVEKGKHTGLLPNFISGLVVFLPSKNASNAYKRVLKLRISGTFLTSSVKE